MFSVITTDYVQDLDLVIFGGICYAATKEHTAVHYFSVFVGKRALLLDSYVVLAVLLLLCLFSSCEIRFYWLTWFGYSRYSL